MLSLEDWTLNVIQYGQYCGHRDLYSQGPHAVWLDVFGDIPGINTV